MENVSSVTKIIEQGSEYLAIPTGIRGGGHALSQLMQLKDSPGWIVDSGMVREWRITSFTRKQGEVYLYGPFFDGASLAGILDKAPGRALGYLLKMVSALMLLADKSVPLFDIQTNAVFFSEEGAVLFLPPALVRLGRASETMADKIHTYDCLNHPDLKGEERLSFAVGALLYRNLTRRFPFESDSEEEIHYRMRDLELVSLMLHVPELKREVADTVARALRKGSKETALTLLDWQQCLVRWAQDGVLRDLPDQEKNSVLLEAQTRQIRAEKQFRRRLYWVRNWRTIAAVSAGVVFVGLVAGSILSNVFAPRSTRGFTPLEVVETFYSSYNRLEHRVMEDCVIGDAGKQEVNEVVNLFALIGMTAQFDADSEFVVAADVWDADGRPEMKESIVYGVVELSVREERSEPSPVFVVEYEKWGPIGDREQAAAVGVPYHGAFMRDRVFLEQDRRDWVIYRFERLTERPLETPE